MAMSSDEDTNRVDTGVPHADEVLNGGLLPGSATLVRGAPGAGKTIFGLHFLAAGVEAGETGLYINLGEPADYLRETARGFGLGIGPVEFLDLSATGGGVPERSDLRSVPLRGGRDVGAGRRDP